MYKQHKISFTHNMFPTALSDINNRTFNNWNTHMNSAELSVILYYNYTISPCNAKSCPKFKDFFSYTNACIWSASVYWYIHQSHVLIVFNIIAPPFVWSQGLKLKHCIVSTVITHVTSSCRANLVCTGRGSAFSQH
jgi:hypothetical protein